MVTVGTPVRIGREAPAPARPSGLHIELERASGEGVLAREPVTGADLTDPHAEVWLEGYLRRGFPGVGLREVCAELRPAYLDGDTERGCQGFRLAVRNPAGVETSLLFPLTSVAPVAARAAQRLVAEGVLTPEETYYYRLRHATGGGAAGSTRPGERIVAAAAAPPPAIGTRRLSPLLAASRPVDTETEHRRADYPVFFTPVARRRAERVARAGADQSPPVETGGLLVGPLFSCPDGGDLFAVVVDVLDASHAEATTYSLTYSGRTWSRIQAILRAQQAHPATRGHRILGQVHGHSFLPDGGLPPCEACAYTPICPRTSAVLSSDDLVWCRAVFHGEPWQLSQIFGLNARGEPVEAFYGQRAGSLATRSYRLLDAPLEDFPSEGAQSP